MFKRPKDTPDSKPAEDKSSPAGTRIVEKTARTEDDASSANRAVTPAYEIRKPAVRTLQSHPSHSASATPANLHVGRGLKLEGKIESCDSLVIEGDVQATIESGTLTISETGEVRGDATVDQAEIQGRFDGTLVVRKCLTINATGKVTGTIRYGELKVEQGGRLTGQVEAADAGSGNTRPPVVSPASRTPVESPE